MFSWLYRIGVVLLAVMRQYHLQLMSPRRMDETDIATPILPWSL
jgi:hypothetical protein